MNLKLAELLESVPPEFRLTTQTQKQLVFKHKSAKIKIYACLFDDGQPYSIEFVNKAANSHRPYSDGPAYMEWYNNRQLREVSYWKNGILHRPSSEGPAFQEFYENGKTKEISYFENGERHRPWTEGPVYQTWYDDGEPRSISYGTRIKF